MARQKLGDKKRSIMIGVKVSPSMRAAIERRAQEAGMTMSSYIHEVLLLKFYGDLALDSISKSRPSA